MVYDHIHVGAATRTHYQQIWGLTEILPAIQYLRQKKLSAILRNIPNFISWRRKTIHARVLPELCLPVVCYRIRCDTIRFRHNHLLITLEFRRSLVTLDMKGCICHFTKWQIHPFISKVTLCLTLFTAKHDYKRNCVVIKTIQSIIYTLNIYCRRLRNIIFWTDISCLF